MGYQSMNLYLCRFLLYVTNRLCIASHVGAQPFQRVMAAKFPEQRTMFVSWKRPKDLKLLSGLLVSMSLRYPA